jgi:class 3 adenylate cyclase
MTTIQSTVIVKTDIKGFTAKVETLPESELGYLLSQHKIFVSEVVAKNGGAIIKGEGDAFWITFPSVNAATNAALDMQKELRVAQIGKNDDERLAIRIVIGLGDVLHQGGDIFGDNVNLVARIESITPPDEIYLSQTAWLALNKAEVLTSFVNEFVLKGIKEPVLVYKIEQQQKTRILKNRIITFVDLSGIARFWDAHPLEDSENLLIHLDDVIKDICEKNGGVIHFVMGDSYFITFPEVNSALTGVTNLAKQWIEFMQESVIDCSLYVGMHKGNVNILRAHVFGDDITTAAALAYQRLLPAQSGKTMVLVSSKIIDDIKGTNWEHSFVRVDNFEEETFSMISDSEKFSRLT